MSGALERDQRRLFPMCGKCGKPVDSIERWDDPQTMEAVLTAVCHGERETLRLDERVFALKGIVNLSAGVAFRQVPALPPERP